MIMGAAVILRHAKFWVPQTSKYPSDGSLQGFAAVADVSPAQTSISGTTCAHGNGPEKSSLVVFYEAITTGN